MSTALPTDAPTRYRAPLLVVVGVMLAVVSLGGCATGDPAVGETSERQTAARPSGERVPAPEGGTIEDTVAEDSPNAIQIAPAIDLSSDATVGDGVVVSIVGLERGQAEPQAPGELGGATLFVTVQVRNESNNRIDLDSAFVTLADSNGILAIPTSGSPATPLTGTLAPQEAAEGIYAFILPQAARRDVTLTVSPTAGLPAAQFVGDARKPQGDQ